MFASGFHKLTFFFSVAAVAVTFYAINEWLGTIAAVLLCIPATVVVILLPAMLIGTIRQSGTGADAALTWVCIVGGIALSVYGVLAHEGASMAMMGLLGGSVAVSGIGLLFARINATRYRAAVGLASQDELLFLADIDSRR